LYRQKKKNEKNLINMHTLVNRNPSASKIPASRFTVRLDETKKDEYHGINSANEGIESDLPKYQELATLVRKHHSKEVANQILSRIKRLYIGGKDNVIEIDKMLEVYRNIDRNRRI
jgi:ribosome-associated translation inhibitor RaiA